MELLENHKDCAGKIFSEVLQYLIIVQLLVCIFIKLVGKLSFKLPILEKTIAKKLYINSK